MHFEPVAGAEISEVEPPAVPGPTPTRSRRRAYTAVGLAIVLLVTVAGAWVVANTLTNTNGAGAAAAGYAYLPDTVSLALEARLDLPADQKQQLATFLARFPDFKDASSVESKLMDWADDAVKNATDDRADYKNDVQSFFAGWAVIGIIPVEQPATQPGDYSFSLPYKPLAAIGSTDKTAAEAAMLKLRSPSLTWTSTTADEITTWTGKPKESSYFGPTFGNEAYAVTDDAVLVGNTADDIKLALDTHASPKGSLLTKPSFAADIARAPGGRLGLVWTEPKGLPALTGMSMNMPGATPAPACANAPPQPDSEIAVLYMRDGRAMVDASATLPAGAPKPNVHRSTLDTHLPADTFLYAESRDVGKTIHDQLACLRDNPSYQYLLTEIEDSVGDIDKLVAWADDAAIGLRYDGTTVTGGVVVGVNDAVKAGEAMGQLRAALEAYGKQAGSVDVSEEDYDGAHVVNFNFHLQGNSLPAPMPATSLSYAIKDDLLVFGIDATFAKAVLDTQAGASLATSPGYSRAIDYLNGRSNAGAVYVDIPRAVELVDKMSKSELGASNGFKEVKKYLDPLDDAAFVVLSDGNVQTVRFALNTRELP
jgi:hypothetical protein